MTSTFDATARPENLTDARTSLDELMAWVGVDGLVAALRTPGLLAEIDQHTTAVRAAIAGAGCPLDALSLSRYARSIMAAAARSGQVLPEGSDADWTRAGWYLVRLVAVCAVADEVGAL